MSRYKDKILFRCEAGEISEVGTGHLFRSIAIAKTLQKKFKILNNEIVFITKTQKKYKISKKILKEYNFKHLCFEDKKIKENSNSELKILAKNPAKILFIDRLGNTKKKSLDILSKVFKKIILIDDITKSQNKSNLLLNSLVLNKKKIKDRYKIFDNLILPSYLNKKFIKNKISKKKPKKIFLSFGGYDANSYTKKITKKILKNNLKINIFINEIYKSKIDKSNKFRFYNKKNYFKNLSKCDLAIVSGGLTLFDCLLFNIPTLCIPQYNHQLDNAKIVEKLKATIVLNLINKKKIKDFDKKFKLIYHNQKLRSQFIKNGNKIINLKKINKNFYKIFKIYLNN